MATGIANNTVEQCWSEAIDMQFYWIRDCICQGHFTVEWKKGKRNLADYFTKHHPKQHHTHKFALHTFSTPLTQNRIISNFSQKMISRIKPEEVFSQQL
jgi:hexokinase